MSLWQGIIMAIVLAGPSSGAATYYLAPTGSDQNSGTSTGSPWLSPLHAVNCGDVILAAAGSYSAANFASGNWGVVTWGAEPDLWRWSSAAIHCGARTDDEYLALEMWRNRWTASAWRDYLGMGEMESTPAVIRRRTHTGRPLGSAEFIHGLEKETQRRLMQQKRGPREKIVTDRSQGELSFDP